MSEALTTTPSAALSAEALIQSAITNKVDVDTMERLLVMRTQLKAENAKEAYYAALSAFQMECPIIAKEKAVMNKDGRSVRYSYAPLDAIVRQVRSLLNAHGFSYRFETSTEGTDVRVSCVALHRDGHSESSTFQTKTDPEAFMNVQQRFGSALTFAKRYAFCNAFGILTGEDDDDSQATTADGPAARRMERIRSMKPAQDAELVNRGPEEDDPRPIKATEEKLDNKTIDFLLYVDSATDAAELTKLALSSRAFTGAASKAATRSIRNRAATLKLTWDSKQEAFLLV